jgi:hypothetical protein
MGILAIAMLLRRLCSIIDDTMVYRLSCLPSLYERNVEGYGVRGNSTISGADAFDVLPLYSMMSFLRRASMGAHLETNFSTALQIGFGKTTRGVKGMQQILRKRRGSGGKIIRAIPSIIATNVDRDSFWCPCLFILLHKGYHKSLG